MPFHAWSSAKQYRCSNHIFSNAYWALSFCFFILMAALALMLTYLHVLLCDNLFLPQLDPLLSSLLLCL